MTERLSRSEIKRRLTESGVTIPVDTVTPELQRMWDEVEAQKPRKTDEVQEPSRL